ncbi:MAG: herpeto-tandem family RiPP [Chloroflexi bacterium]|nr:herpeto-tandem family RiPP [Chloroflexota bacterium]
MRDHTMLVEKTEDVIIFGLTYLEEEAAEIQDVVGCLMPIGSEGYTVTGCDDSDGGNPGEMIP